MCGNSSEPAAHTAALVAPAAVAAPAAQGEVTLALLPDVIRHLRKKKKRDMSKAFVFSVSPSPQAERSPWCSVGKTQLLKF